MVPVESGGIYFTDCPNCGYGAEEAECFNKTWDPRAPRQIRCRGCGEVYPNNEKYPDDTFIEVDAPGGEKHRFHYWARKDGYRTWFRAHAGYWAREWLQDQCQYLGELYAATGEDPYAVRAAAILSRFAEVYPGWATIFDYPFRQKLIHPYTVTCIPGMRDYRSSRWTWWAYMDIRSELARGYDGIRDWPGWKDGQREQIKRDLVVPLVDFVLGIDESYSNMSMGMWQSAIDSGRAFDEPRWVHEAIRRLEHLLKTRFLYDGHWRETSDSYAAQTQGGLQVVMEAIDAYSDPPGYKDAVDGRRFDNVVARELVPGYNLAEWTVGAVRFPDNRLIPVNDTWAVHGKTSHFRRAVSREKMEPVLLPGVGLAVMGGGAGEHQLHAYLNYTKGIGHKQLDALSIGLFAFGKELFPDIGYTWSNYHVHWTNRMMSHNTVVVNGVDCGYDAKHTAYRLREFATNGKDFHYSSVDADTYPGVASRYRRTLVVVGEDSRDCYLIDIFEVRGGHQHDYLLLGSVDEDSTATVDGVDLKHFDGTLLNEGVKFQLPKDYRTPNPAGHAFGFFTDLQAGDVTGATVTLDMRLDATPTIGTRTIIAPGPNTTIYLGRVPSVRRARESNGLLDRDKAPAWCIRRQGDELRSTFVAIHEPVKGEPKLRSLTVERDGDSLQLRIDRGAHGTDRFAIGPKIQLTRQSGRTITIALGWSGTVHRHGREEGDGFRGWFDIAESVNTDHAGILLIHFADNTQRAFNLVRGERTMTGTRLYVREDPGFDVKEGKVTLTSCPQRVIDGAALRYSLSRVTAD
ncbi:MAG: heparinase II/III family protein, partial [Lentisphaeria bacterium]|nr:heparinase II/III family protein [Lentisphaeria bacterium]